MNKREYSSGRIVKQALQDKLIEHKHYIREWRRPARSLDYELAARSVVVLEST